jgi:hypothetical protein
MASATLRLSVDPVTGQRTITIAYARDPDALPQEHEEAHRALVERLFEGGIAGPGDTIAVTREGERGSPAIGDAEEALAGHERATREGS